MKKPVAVILAIILIFQVQAAAFVLVNVTSEIATIKNYYVTNVQTLQNAEETYILSAVGVSLNGNPLSPAAINAVDLNDNSKFINTASKLILTALAKGQDPKTCVAGRNIVSDLAAKQGVDGSFGSIYTHVFAIYALKGANQAFNEDKAAEFLVNKQLSDGGYSYNDQLPGDIDSTAMLLTVLEYYKDKPLVSQCLTKAIDFVKSSQNALGGFDSWGTDNSNTLAVAIVGMIDAGFDVSSVQFKNMPQSLMRFKNTDGTYRYSIDSDNIFDAYATSQVLMAYDAVKNGSSLYMRMLKTGSFAPKVDNSSPSSISSSTSSQNPSTNDGIVMIFTLFIASSIMILSVKKAKSKGEKIER